ncbi:MAG: cystathionine beta-lyase [Chlorobi bacterium]|nr:cystathionine beta-lyase [Chlorobiota bacterium]
MKPGELDGVNPPVSDSATFKFSTADIMSETFEGKTEGCFLYSRHWNPTNHRLADAIAAMEGAEAGWVTASGMAAITTTILQLCCSGDHIVSSMTTYGGTFAFFRNFLPKFNIEVTFVDITDPEAVKDAVRDNTRLIYTETVTNPLLQVSDISLLAGLARKYNLKLVVDNTFTPMIVSPLLLGADIVVYSMTKFINGKNDSISGAICGPREFIDSLIDVNNGTAMLLGPVLDPLRASSILKNIYSLHIRMKKHSENALFLAEQLDKHGLKVRHPGLPDHPGHGVMKEMMHTQFGFGGLLTLDAGDTETAGKLMLSLQEKDVGYLAVSLGYFKTLFSNSGTSTSSEVPMDVQKKMGLSPGLIRFSIGLDPDIRDTWQRMKESLQETGMI